MFILNSNITMFIANSMMMVLLLLLQCVSCAILPYRPVAEELGILSWKIWFHIDSNRPVPQALQKNFTAAFEAFKKHPFDIEARGSIDGQQGPIIFLRSFRDKTVYQVKQKIRESRQGVLYSGVNVLTGLQVDLKLVNWKSQSEQVHYHRMNGLVGSFIGNYLPLRHFGDRTLAQELSDEHSPFDKAHLYRLAKRELLNLHVNYLAPVDGPYAHDFVVESSDGSVRVHLVNLGNCLSFTNLEPIEINYLTLAADVQKISRGRGMREVQGATSEDLTNPPNLEYFSKLSQIRAKEQEDRQRQ